MNTQNQASSLDVIAIETPCQMDWDLMTGDEQIRFCSHCTKNVYNITMMTQEEALATINRHEGELCLRFYRRADGTIVTADCPPVKKYDQRISFRRRLQFSLASLLMLLTASAGLTAAAPWINKKIQPLVTYLFPTKQPVRAVKVPPQPQGWVNGGLGIGPVGTGPAAAPATTPVDDI